MNFELDESVQILEPITKVWRNATVLSKDHNNYIVNLISTKSTIELSSNSIRKAKSERVVQKTQLKCKSSELISLVYEDKVVFTLNGKTQEGQVLENDPFDCEVKLSMENGINDYLQYESIIVTSKNLNYEKLATKLTNDIGDIEDADKIINNNNTNTTNNQISTVSNNNENKIETSHAITRRTTMFRTYRKKPRYFYEYKANNINKSLLTHSNPTTSATTTSTTSTSAATSATNTSTIKKTVTIMPPPNMLQESTTSTTSPTSIHRSLNESLHNMSSNEQSNRSISRIFPVRQTSHNGVLHHRNVRNLETISPPNTQSEPSSSDSFTTNLSFNNYMDNLTHKLTQRIDTQSLSSSQCIAELTKAVIESTNKITLSIDRLSSVITDYLQQKAMYCNMDAESSIDYASDRQPLTPSEQTDLLNQTQYTNDQDYNTNNNSHSEQVSSNILIPNVSQPQPPPPLPPPPPPPVSINYPVRILDNFNVEYLSQDDIADIKVKSKSAVVFSSNLMERLFMPSEFIGHNVNGRGMNKLDVKKKLDPVRINYIEKLVNKYFNPGRKVNLWPKCVKRMNRRILELCPANKNRRVRIKQDLD